jgi:hypothetical protein
VQITVDSKHKLILDHEVTNEVKDNNQLSKMSKRAKDILGIKECVDDNIIPYIPEPDPNVSKRINIPEPLFYKREFRYDKEMDVYICPAGFEISFRNRAEIHGKMKRYWKR